MPDGREEMLHASVIRSGPTSGREEMMHASAIRTKYPDGLLTMMHVSVIIPIRSRPVRRGCIISDA